MRVKGISVFADYLQCLYALCAWRCLQIPGLTQPTTECPFYLGSSIKAINRKAKQIQPLSEFSCSIRPLETIAYQGCIQDFFLGGNADSRITYIILDLVLYTIIVSRGGGTQAGGIPVRPLPLYATLLTGRHPSLGLEFFIWLFPFWRITYPLST